MNLWHWWIIAGVILFILEIFTPGFILACFGVACAVTALASYLGCSIKMQIVIFSAANIIIFFGIRPFFLKFLSSNKHAVRTNTEALIGKIGIVTESIDPNSDIGRVKVGGEDWRAISNSNTKISAGQKIMVKKVDGTKLFVDLSVTE